MMLTKQQREELAVAVYLAKESANKVNATELIPDYARTGLAKLTVAQWADESGWGQHQTENNPFGIKAVEGQRSVSLATTEYVDGVARKVFQDFACFDTMNEAFDAHAKLITTGANFAPAWNEYCQSQQIPIVSFQNFVRSIAVHYATYPKYGDLILSICGMYEVWTLFCNDPY